MGNIVRWFEDFPGRVLDLMPDMKTVAAERDRLGTLSMLLAPALIVAPYERLQTFDPRRNPQADYLRFAEAHGRFDAIMRGHFRDAPFWSRGGRAQLGSWKGSRMPQIVRDPQDWRSERGFGPPQDEFWHIDIGAQETRWVWKLLRDALSHWNVANADHEHLRFDEGGVMQRLVLYRSPRESRPWDVISVPTETFLAFLNDWAQFLSRGLGREMLAATEAA